MVNYAKNIWYFAWDKNRKLFMIACTNYLINLIKLSIEQLFKPFSFSFIDFQCWDGLFVPFYEWGSFYSEVVTLSRLQWLGVKDLSSLCWSSSAFRSGERSASSPPSSRRATRQSRWVLLCGVMLKTRMRRCEAICRHTPVQYRVKSSRERI